MSRRQIRGVEVKGIGTCASTRTTIISVVEQYRGGCFLVRLFGRSFVWNDRARVSRIFSGFDCDLSWVSLRFRSTMVLMIWKVWSELRPSQSENCFWMVLSWRWAEGGMAKFITLMQFLSCPVEFPPQTLFCRFAWSLCGAEINIQLHDAHCGL